MYAPKLYRYFCRLFKKLFTRHPELRHNFNNSAFPASTFNCGPDAVTFDHLDLLDFSRGIWGITCGGDFDHTRGGHIHLRQLRLVLQCPSGASAIIPSGCLGHGNIPIQPDEMRHFMTQYATGGLFRWAVYGFQSAKLLLARGKGYAMRSMGNQGRGGNGL
ncbi:hypothetical protein B0H11DRAFT_2357831 [Mycena galericulata]|nr:hypothetical protein B0H11DRAFT_2357831 [Mycena galericulata]